MHRLRAAKSFMKRVYLLKFENLSLTDIDEQAGTAKITLYKSNYSSNN